MLTKNLLPKLIEYFDSYTSEIDVKDVDAKQSIDQQINHSVRVMEHMAKLCEVLELDEEEISLARFIGLFHDFGRFEQYKRYSSFNDKETESHAILGIKLIEENELNKELDEEENNILRSAILLHNQLQLPKKEDEKVLLYSRLLRDADKLDLWDMHVNQFASKFVSDNLLIDPNLSPLSKISDRVYADIMEGRQVNVDDLKTQNDYKLMLMSMVFDINFKYSFKVLNKQQFIKKIYDTMPKTDKIIDSYRNIKIHIENQFLL